MAIIQCITFTTYRNSNLIIQIYNYYYYSYSVYALLPQSSPFNYFIVLLHRPLFIAHNYSFRTIYSDCIVLAERALLAFFTSKLCVCVCLHLAMYNLSLLLHTPRPSLKLHQMVDKVFVISEYQRANAHHRKLKTFIQNIVYDCDERRVISLIRFFFINVFLLIFLPAFFLSVISESFMQRCDVECCRQACFSLSISLQFFGSLNENISIAFFLGGVIAFLFPCRRISWLIAEYKKKGHRFGPLDRFGSGLLLLKLKNLLNCMRGRGWYFISKVLGQNMLGKGQNDVLSF